MNLTDHNETKAMIVKRFQTASENMMKLANELYTNLVKGWEDRGGCKTCNGTGSVLTWSTLDGSGWDEFGTCKDCTEESRKMGKKPGVYQARGSGNRYEDLPLEVAKREFPLAMKDVIEAYEIAASNHAVCVTNGLNRGEYIIVVKGRKVPVGDHGVIVGISHGQWGMKVGFVNGEGKVQWTAVTNVERCLGMDGEGKRPALEAFCKSENDYRAKKGLPAKQHDVVAMMMQMV